MYYVLKNGDGYMGADGMLTDKAGALKIDPQLVHALRHGGWHAGCFREVMPDDLNYGAGVRIVKVNTADDHAGDPADATTIVAGRRI